MKNKSTINKIPADVQKQAYLDAFVHKYHPAFKPHLTEGGLGPEAETWIQNALPHCIMAGVYAEIFIDELQNTKNPDYLIKKDVKRQIIYAAIMHDWYKKHEQLQIRLAQAVGEFSLDTLTSIKKQETEKLTEMGIDPYIIHLTGANVPETVAGPQTLPENIVWYIDAMLYITEAVPIEKRFTDAERGWNGKEEDKERAKRNKAFSNLYKPLYNGRPLFEVQREIGKRLSKEFADAVRYEGKADDFPLYLKNKFVKIIQT